MNDRKSRILSGIQPTGDLHVGNYFGMMRPAIELQTRGEAFYFIADYHALTLMPDPDSLRSHTFRVAADFLACGLDPRATVFFRQSEVPEVTELTWLLSSVTPMGLLERCHSYKDKIARGIAANHGLFSYPVLMAADILLYQSNYVPVGRDQKQHLEVTRDIAVKFNIAYGEVFTVPEPLIREATAVVPGTDGEKMSKSYGNTIPLFGSRKETRSAVMRVVTDSRPIEEPKDPEGIVVYQILRAVASEEDVARVGEGFREGRMGYGDAKKILFESLWGHFEPFRERREQLERNPDEVEEILRDGARRAREAAAGTLDRARQAVGLLPRRM